MDYFYSNDGNRWTGPVSAKELKDLAASGIITPMSLLMSPDRLPPTPAHKAKGLFSSDTPSNAVVPSDGKGGFSLFGTVTSLATTATQGVTSVATQTVSKATDAVTQTASFAAGGVSSIVQSFYNQAGNCLAILTPEPGKTVEDIIGPVLPLDGTRIAGTVEEEPSINIPPRFMRGNTMVLIHYQGIRIQPSKEEPLLVRKEQLIEAQQRKEKEAIVESDAAEAIFGAVVGGMLFGPPGAIIGGMGGAGKTILADAFFMEFCFDNSTGNVSRMVLRVDKQEAKKFSKELMDFLGVQKKGFWSWG